MGNLDYYINNIYRCDFLLHEGVFFFEEPQYIKIVSNPSNLSIHLREREYVPMYVCMKFCK